VQAGCTVCVDLSDFGFDVSLGNGSASLLKDFDCFAEVLDSFFVGLLAELVVAFLFKCRNLVFNQTVVSAIVSFLWSFLLGLFFGRRGRLGCFSFWLLFFLLSNRLSFGWFCLLDFFYDWCRRRSCCRRGLSFGLSVCRRFKFGQIGQGDILIVWNVALSFVLLDVLLTTLDTLLGLLVHGLELTHPH